MPIRRRKQKHIKGGGHSVLWLGSLTVLASISNLSPFTRQQPPDLRVGACLPDHLLTTVSKT